MEKVVMRLALWSNFTWHINCNQVQGFEVFSLQCQLKWGHRKNNKGNERQHQVNWSICAQRISIYECIKTVHTQAASEQAVLRSIASVWINFVLSIRANLNSQFEWKLIESICIVKCSHLHSIGHIIQITDH